MNMQKVSTNFSSQLEKDYNFFKWLESRVMNKSGKDYFAAKANLVKSFMNEGN